MRKAEGGPNAQMTKSERTLLSSFGFGHSFVIRHSSFVIAHHFDLYRQLGHRRPPRRLSSGTAAKERELSFLLAAQLLGADQHDRAHGHHRPGRRFRHDITDY